MEPTSRSSNWPRLSLRLAGPRQRGQCQSCATCAHHVDGWIEHDHNDQPEPIIVFLCAICSGRLIEPHVRVYRRLSKFEPFPGAMDLCDRCVHRDGLRCINPLAKINGGPGLKYTQESPLQGFWDGTDKQGRRTGGRLIQYTAPATACSGQETKKQ